jgi:hypothetical protein
MLEEDTEAARYWKKCGDDALAHRVKGIIIMVGCLCVLCKSESSTRKVPLPFCDTLTIS